MRAGRFAPAFPAGDRRLRRRGNTCAGMKFFCIEEAIAAMYARDVQRHTKTVRTLLRGDVPNAVIAIAQSFAQPADHRQTFESRARGA